MSSADQTRTNVRPKDQMQDDVTQPGSPVPGANSSEFRGRSPGPYRPGTSWRTWLRLFNNYLTLRKVECEKEKRLFLLQEIGMSNYELVDSLLQGKLPEDTNFLTLCQILESHFQPKRLLMAERFKLASMTQRPDQTLQNFYAELQQEAAHCGFDKINDFRDAQVTLFFIGGISSLDTRKRLLEKEELTSKEALEIAEAFERVGSNAPHLKEGNRPVGVGNVQGYSSRGKGGKSHKFSNNFHKKGKHLSKPTDSHQPKPQSIVCTVCGKPGHSNSKCSIRNRAYCTFCKCPGHLLNACFKAKRAPLKGVHNIEQEADEEDIDYIYSLSPNPHNIHSLRAVGNNQYSTMYNNKIVSRAPLLRIPRGEIPRGLAQAAMTPVASQVKIACEKEGTTVPRVDALHFDPPIMLSFRLNGRETNCELDTGAAMSIISTDTWEKIGKPTIFPTTLTAYAYNQSPVSFIGKVEILAEFKGKQAMVEIQVLDMPVRSLCGRDMIRKLKIDCGPHYRESIEHNKNSISLLQPDLDPKTCSIELNRIIHENISLFSTELGKCTTTQASLKFKSDNPVPKFWRARPVPFALRTKVEAKLDELTKSGTIVRVEHSEWATPLVVVPKHGGKIRLCGDYKVTVNPQLDINQYPLPIPDDMFHLLHGGKKFSKMDLSDAYMQVELDNDSRKYTTINTHKGLFEYTRVPFGVSSAPAIFQRIMETTLAGIEGVLIYLDDITVTAPDDKTHLQRLREVLSRLNTAGFRLKRDKCEFLKPQIEFLGHVVDGTGIRPSPEKLRAMVNMPAPKNLKEVESFIGMVQYYGKFIPNLSTLAAPLNGLRRQGVVFKWEKEQQQAFLTIKKRLTAADVLTHYDPKIPVILATDASDYGLGAVIYHKFSDNTEKVIAYASRSLTKAEKNYAQIEKEALGIVYGVEKFNQFLYGRKFTLLTDHQPLVKIFGPKNGLPVIAAKRLHRWGLRLMVYSFDIEYRNTNEFGNADGLSRLPDPRELPSAEATLNEIHATTLDKELLDSLPFSVEELSKATREDSILQEVAKYIQQGWPDRVKGPVQAYSNKHELSMYQGCILWNLRVVIPQKFQTKVLSMLHSSHYGRNRMIALARTKIWYPGIDKDIENMAKACKTCAMFGNNPKRTPLKPWEEPALPWQRLHMDFCETEGGIRWLIIIDAKSKWPCVEKMSTTTASKTCDKLSEIFATHGLPEEIVSDNGPQFTSSEFREFCKQRNIEQTLTPPYHPNSNGEAERFVQTFKKGFYKSKQAGHSTESAVTQLLFQYRVTPHPATGISPAEGLMGRKLRTVLDIFKNEQKTIPNNKYREDMKKYYDRGKLPREEFHVGEECYLRGYNPNGDLWLPGIITAKYSSHTYEVNYGTGTRKAHIDQMKKRVKYSEELPVQLKATPRLPQPVINPTIPLRRTTRPSRPPARYGDGTLHVQKRPNVNAIYAFSHFPCCENTVEKSSIRDYQLGEGNGKSQLNCNATPRHLSTLGKSWRSSLIKTNSELAKGESRRCSLKKTNSELANSESKRSNPKEMNSELASESRRSSPIETNSELAKIFELHGETRLCENYTKLTFNRYIDEVVFRSENQIYLYHLYRFWFRLSKNTMNSALSGSLDSIFRLLSPNFKSSAHLSLSETKLVTRGGVRENCNLSTSTNISEEED